MKCDLTWGLRFILKRFIYTLLPFERGTIFPTCPPGNSTLQPRTCASLVPLLWSVSLKYFASLLSIIEVGASVYLPTSSQCADSAREMASDPPSRRARPAAGSEYSAWSQLALSTQKCSLSKESIHFRWSSKQGNDEHLCLSIKSRRTLSTKNKPKISKYLLTYVSLCCEDE